MHPAAVAAQSAQKIAIRLGGETASYAELDDRSAAIARLMASLGLKQGDVMAIWSGNHIDFLACCWAAQRSGLYYLPIGAGLTASEAAYILIDSSARALIVDVDRAALLADLHAVEPKAKTVPSFCLDDAPGTAQLWTETERVSSHPDPAAVEGGDMLYTSGTTGKPKGVRRPLTLAPLGSEVDRVERLRALFDVGPDTVFLSPGPLYHAASLRFAIATLRLGGELVLMSRFDAEQALETLMSAAVTHSHWVPTMFVRMLALPETTRSAYDAPAHRVAIHAGAPCPRDVKRRMIDWFGPILHEYYSGTESIGSTHINSKDWLERPGSVGRPWGCKIHVLDENGGELGPHQAGIVYFEGRSGLLYHNADDKTRDAHSVEGWATMGDIGHVDADGFLFLTDRQAFTIISGGVNVYPREVEEVLTAHPDVLDTAVFGVPDPDFGEVVQAVVLPRDEANQRRLAQVLFALSRERLAPPKRPKRIAFRTDFPLTDSGKILKRVLQDDYRDPAERGYRPETGVPA